MKKTLIIILFTFLIYLTVYADSFGLIILKSSGSACLSSSNSHKIVRDWFEEILKDSLNNKIVFDDTVLVINLNNFSREENLKLYYQQIIRSTYNITDNKSINHQKLKAELFENFNLRFLCEIELSCLSNINYFIFKMYDLKKNTEMSYRFEIPLIAFTNKTKFKKEMWNFIDTIFNKKNNFDINIPSFIWDFASKKKVLNLEGNVEVRTNYDIKYTWKIYKLKFPEGLNSLLLIDPNLLNDKVYELQDSLSIDSSVQLGKIKVEIELIEVVHNQFLDLNEINLSGANYYYIVGLKINPIYDYSMMVSKTVLIGSYKKNIFGLNFNADYTTNKFNFMLSPYYQKNFLVRNQIIGLRANYLFEYKKRNKNKYVFQSAFVTSGPLIGFGEYRTFIIDTFFGFGIANLHEDYTNIFAIQLGVNKGVKDNKILGIYLRYIKDINSRVSNLYLGCTISTHPYIIK